MVKIVRKQVLNPSVTLLEVEAPRIAKKAQAGQFIILRLDEEGERIPLTIGDYDREKGTITIMFQKVGLTTQLLGDLNEGDTIRDFVGPLGQPTRPELGDDIKRVCVVGGGVGCAIAYPQAKSLHAEGIEVDVIAGFRSKDIVILEEEFKAASDHFYLTTDDGSYGEKGFVTDKLKALIEAGNKCDCHRPRAHDEICVQDHRALWDQDAGQPEPHHDRRHRHVRLLPRDGGRQDEVCLRGRPRL